MTLAASTGSAVRLVLGTNNVYALPDGAGVTLVDAGPDYHGAWEELLAQLVANGYAPQDVHTVLLTHDHLDHAGLAARWQAVGARVLIGREDAASLAADDRAREEERIRARRELVRHGVPPQALSVRPARGERYTRWPAPLQMTPVQPDGVLDDGDCIGRGDHRLRVVACPGHTPGTVLLLDESTGACFTGDHVLPRMAPTSGIQFDGERRRPSLPAYLVSLHKARRLADRVTTVLPGHGDPLDGLAEAVDWTVRLLEQRARRTLARLREGPATAYELAKRMFPHLGPRHLRPTMAEIIGLLDLLAERRLAAAHATEERVTWHAMSSTRAPTAAAL
jgi:glyoxylase-like metal-dependent hydrolase (beta-lactamase superfamily II)